MTDSNDSSAKRIPIGTPDNPVTYTGADVIRLVMQDIKAATSTIDAMCAAYALGEGYGEDCEDDCGSTIEGELQNIRDSADRLRWHVGRLPVEELKMVDWGMSNAYVNPQLWGQSEEESDRWLSHMIAKSLSTPA